MVDIFTKEDKDVAHFESVRDQMVMPRESFRLPIKAKSWGVLQRRLDDSNYERLTQSIKRKAKKNMNDVSVVDATVQLDNKKVRLDNKNDTDNDTIIIDTDNDTSKPQVTWVDHGPQQTNYGDDSDKTDISETITSVNKPYKYHSYKDACNGRTITHGSDTVTHGDTPTTTPQVTSE